jgi:hypothetical protein
MALNISLSRIIKQLAGHSAYLIIAIFAPLLLLGLFSQPAITASAQGTEYDPCEVFGNCLGGTQDFANESADSIVVSLVLGFSFFLIFVGGAIAVLFIVFGGYKLITANGNDADYKAGRSMVTNAVIGLVLIIISVTIVRVVSEVLTGIRLPPVFG